MNILGQDPNDNPTVLFFGIGIGIVLLVVYGLIFKGDAAASQEKERDSTLYSLKDYKNLAEKTRDNWLNISRNNRIYLGALIVSFGIQKFGQLSEHPIFGSSLVISLTYLIAFTSCFKHLVKGRTSDEQIISCAIKGIHLEKSHPEWNVDYFHKFIKSYQGFEMFSLAFFRVVIPAWLLFSAIDFGVIARWSEFWPKWGIVSISLTIFSLAALFLWRIGCKSYHFLRIRGKEVLA